MLMSKIKKNGFTLIEVMCSLLVFSLLMFTALSIKISVAKIETYNDTETKYSIYLEDVKNELLSNASCDDINNLVSSGKKYINLNDNTDSDLQNKNIIQCFEIEHIEEKPYIEMTVENAELQRVNLQLYVKILNKDKILNCGFYKGKF